MITSEGGRSVEFGGKLGDTKDLRVRLPEGRMTDSPHDGIRSGALTAILICPDDHRRKALALALSQTRAAVVREFSGYPSSNNLKAEDLDCDVVLVDLDASQ